MEGDKMMLERLKEIGMTVNQLSLLSGVRNSHLKQILNGYTRRPGRNILIRLALALSYGVRDINVLLKTYEQKEELSGTDIAYFKEAIEKRQNRSGYSAIHPGGFNFEIATMSVEKTAGDIRLVTPVPHIVFRDFEEYFSRVLVSETEKQDNIYKEIRRFLFNERIRMFDENIREHKVSHLICKDCFVSYIRKRKENTDTENIIKEFDTILRRLAHENYDLKLTERCSCFKFHLRVPQNQGKKPGIVFSGNPVHPASSCSSEHGDETGALVGFVSDSEDLYNYFTIEFERLSRFAPQESSDKSRLAQYIAELLEENGIKGRWKI